jgi:hypothetical protein
LTYPHNSELPSSTAHESGLAVEDLLSFFY